LRVHDLGVCGGVFLDDRELDLGPDADLVVLNRRNKTVSECLNQNLTASHSAQRSQISSAAA
jgi:hypothetical protein